LQTSVPVPALRLVGNVTPEIVWRPSTTPPLQIALGDEPGELHLTDELSLAG
jgi:hypothetical protein